MRPGLLIFWAQHRVCYKNNLLSLHGHGMKAVNRIFLCISIVIWSLLIHFAPLGGERNIFDSFILLIFPVTLIAEVAEMWRKQG